MKTKNSNLEYIAFNINSVFSLVAIISIIVRSEVAIIAVILCIQQVGLHSSSTLIHNL